MWLACIWIRPSARWCCAWMRRARSRRWIGPRRSCRCSRAVPERATHDYRRSGTSSLYAALDIASGQVISSLHSRHRAIEFKKFLQRLDREVPAELEVHLVLDNASTHKTPAIRKWLLAHPRFVLHFTPTSSSWLNLVERWFGELTDKKLRRGAHRSVRDLNADIRSWVNTWNENPRPFVWTKGAIHLSQVGSGSCRQLATTIRARTASCWHGSQTITRASTTWSGCAGRTDSAAHGASVVPAGD